MLVFCPPGSQQGSSRNTTIEMYECGYDGQLAYCEYVKVYISEAYPTAEIPPVMKVQLNSHNITRDEKTILDACWYDDKTSISRKFEETLDWSLM